MNIEITDWDITPEMGTLVIGYLTKNDEEMCLILQDENLYNALVDVGVFDGYDGHEFLTKTINYRRMPSAKMTISVGCFWHDFNHLVDTRIMKQLVELKMKTP